MSSFTLSDSAGATKFFKASSGDGSTGSPFIQEVVLGAGTSAIGSVSVTAQSTTTLVNGQKAVTNSAAAIASTTALKFGVVVKFMSGTGPIFVGATGVSASTGYKLTNVGDTTPLLQVNDAANIFVISSNSSGDTACFIGA